MNTEHVKSPACVQTTLFEIAHAARDCLHELAQLEDCINEIVSSTAEPEQNQIVRLQRLDYIRQVQNEIYTSLHYMSQNDLGIQDVENEIFDISELLSKLKLGGFKERLLRATSVYQNMSEDAQPETTSSSDVLFFTED